MALHPQPKHVLPGRARPRAGASATRCQQTVSQSPRAVLNRPEFQKCVHLDGMNYASTHFFTSSDHFRVQEAADNVARYVQAAAESGIGLTVFIDAAAPSEEAQHKWRVRQEFAVRDGRRNVPHGVNDLLAEMFRRNGVQVLLSVSHDNDDTLAAYAQADGASVLSNDKDFFRYRGATFAKYSDFKLEGQPERLVLVAAEAPSGRRQPQQRDLPSPLPLVSEGRASLVSFLHGAAGGPVALYACGTPSPLTRALSVNLHAAVRPLRLALYGRLRRQGALLQGGVRELFPGWSAAEGRVVWDEQVHIDVDALVGAAPTAEMQEMDALLDRPHDALARIFPKPWPAAPPATHLLDYNNHIFAMHAVVFELCCMANPALSLLDLLAAVAAAEHPPRSWPERPAERVAHTFTCAGCRARVDMLQGEVDYYSERGFTLPRRCKACRAAAKQWMGARG